MHYIIATQGIFPSHDDPTAADPTIPFLGQIIAFAGEFAPKGWAFCDGQILSIAQNTALFSLLGTTFGGNGQTTFALPNLDDRVIIGSSGTYPIGSVVGSNISTVTPAQLPAFSMATLGAHQATLNQVPGGFAISDTAANIGSAAGLAALTGDIGHITTITATDTAVNVGFGRFAPYQAALDKITGGFVFDGQAPVIQANIDAIAADAAHISSIIAENGTVTVSVATLATDIAGLNKIVGGFAISDTAANIGSVAGLAALTADIGHINAITATDTQVVVGIGRFIPYQAALDKIVGGFTIDGQAPVIQANIGALNADIAHINSITAENGTVSVSVATFGADMAALNEIVGGFAISDTAANIFNGSAVCSRMSVISPRSRRRMCGCRLASASSSLTKLRSTRSSAVSTFSGCRAISARTSTRSPPIFRISARSRSPTHRRR